jgi:DNA polymerase III subunit delta
MPYAGVRRNPKPLANVSGGALSWRMHKPVYLFHGDDEFLVSRMARKTVDELVPPDRQTMSLEVIQAQDVTVERIVAAISECILSLRTVGLFSSDRVVWLRDLQLPPDGGRRSISEDILRKIEDLTTILTSGVPPGVTLVISSPITLPFAGLVKACGMAGEVVSLGGAGRPSDEKKRVAQVLDSLLRELGLEMSGDARMAFSERVSGSSRDVANELAKLKTYAGGRTRITGEDIESVASQSGEVSPWALSDMVADRNLAGALDTLRRMMYQKESGIGILVQLQSRVRDLLILREAMDRKWMRLAGQNPQWGQLPPEVDELYSRVAGGAPRSVPPYRQGRRAAQAARFARAELLECQEALLQAHQELVSGSQDESAVLEAALIKMLA